MYHSDFANTLSQSQGQEGSDTYVTGYSDRQLKAEGGKKRLLFTEQRTPHTPRTTMMMCS